MTNPRQRMLRRAALALSLVAVNLAFSGVASAQTTFEASINGINRKADPPCAPTITSPALTAVFCGNANIAGYGPAIWTANIITPFSSPGCFNYESTTQFILRSDGSTLVLDEKGLACTPGNSSSNPSQGFGGPIYVKNSNWTVTSATGQFSGLTGSGTDTVRANGARTSGTYTGTLGK